MKETLHNQNQENQKLIIADKGTRLGHNIIDTIGFYFIIFLNAMILDGWLNIMPEEGSAWLIVYFFSIYVIYFTLFEFFFGKTPGKFLTKTKVVKKDGSRPGFINILGRNTARLIPFDSLSYLFERGWHDQISNTYVVIDKKNKKQFNTSNTAEKSRQKTLKITCATCDTENNSSSKYCMNCGFEL